MATTKLKTGIIGAIVVASVVTPFVLQNRAQGKLRRADDVLEQQASQLAQLTSDNQRLASLLARAKSGPPRRNDQLSDLTKLRGEVGRLRNRVQELTKTAAFRETEAKLPPDQVWPARLNRLKQWLEENPSEKTPELRLLPDVTRLFSMYPRAQETDEECRRSMSVVRANAKSRVVNALTEALRRFAKDNGRQFPTALAQLKPYFNSSIEDDMLERWTILPASRLVSELPPGGDWVITENAPVNKALDSRIAIGLTAKIRSDGVRRR